MNITLAVSGVATFISLFAGGVHWYEEHAHPCDTSHHWDTLDLDSDGGHTWLSAQHHHGSPQPCPSDQAGDARDP